MDAFEKWWSVPQPKLDDGKFHDGKEVASEAFQAGRRAGLEEAWQPIATAPKGGGAELVSDPKWVDPPIILIRFGDEAVSVARWDWYYADGGTGYRDGFAWIEPCSGEPLNLHYSTPPSQWMHIPTILAAMEGTAP